MLFNHTIGLEQVDQGKRLQTRTAVRAVIIKDDQLLMVTNNKGDIKFPGGGVELTENHEQAVVREVLEETGHSVATVEEQIGVVVERRIDSYVDDMIFEMTSHYYRCQVTGAIEAMNLDDYEAEMNFEPKWVAIDEAIRQNEGVVNTSTANPWVKRELFVLRELKKTCC